MKYIYGLLFLLITGSSLIAQNISFPDYNLEKGIRANLKIGLSGAVTSQMVNNIEYLNLNGLGIQNLSGIENFPNLISIDLSSNDLNDISILNSLNNLRYLDLGDNRLTALNTISALRNCIIHIENNHFTVNPNVHHSNTIEGFGVQRGSESLGNFNFTIRPEILDANLRKVRIYYRSGSDINQNALINVGDTRLTSDPLDYGLYNIISDGQLRYIDHTFRKTGEVTMFMYFSSGGSQSNRIDKTFTLNSSTVTLRSSLSNFTLIGNTTNTTSISLITGTSFTGNARIVGTNASSFSLNTTNVNLSGSGTQNLSVTFNGAGSGTRTATLEIFNASGVALSVPITGTVQVNDACLSPSVSSIQIPTGNTDAPRQYFFDLANTSAGRSVTVNNIQFTGADAQYFTYDPGLFSTPRTINASVSTGFLVKVVGNLTQNRNYNANLVFSTDNPLCPSVTIPVTAVNQNSEVSWVEPVDGNTVTFANGFAPFVLKWQGFVQGSTPIERAVQIQYSIEGGPWTHVSQSSVDCTKGHDNDNVNIDNFPLTDANAVGKKVQFRIKPCNTNVPWQYSGFSNVISLGYKPIEVAYPNGNEVFNSGEKRTIRWNDYIGYTNVDLYYSTNSGNSYNLIAQNVPAANGSYDWTVPNGNFGLVALVKVKAANVEDVSDYLFNIQTPPVPITLSDISIGAEGCKPIAEGNISFKINGGSPPFSACFLNPAPGETNCNQTFSGSPQIINLGNLRSRNYIVQVRDANNKIQEFEFFVPLKASYGHFLTTTDDICSGGKGSMSFLLSGDYPYPSQMTLTKGGSQIYQGNSPFANDLTTGVYQATITGADGCAYTEEFAIDSSPGTYFPITPTITNTTCGNSIGAISLNVGAAQSPTFSWSNGATTQNLSSLPLGEYNVSVSDASGCILSQTFNILEDAGLVYNNLGNYQAWNVSALGSNKLFFGNDAIVNGQRHITALNLSTNLTSQLTYSNPNNPTWTNTYRGLSFDNNKVAATNEFSNGLHLLLFNAQNNNLEKSIIYPLNNPGSRWTKLVGSKIYVSVIENGVYRIKVFDFNTSQNIANFDFTDYVYHMDFSTDKSKLYVTSGNLLTVIDIASNQVQQTKSLSRQVFMVKEQANSLYLVTRHQTNGLDFKIEKYSLPNLTFISDVSCGPANWTSKIASDNNGNFYFPNNILGSSPNEFKIQIYDTNQDNISSEIIVSTSQISGNNSLEFDNASNRLYAVGSNIAYYSSNKFDFTTAKTDATCGLNNGSINLTIPNDGKTYTYLWSNGATTQNVNGLAAATYEVTVSQTGGCSVKKSVTIVQNGPVIAGGTVSPATQTICMDAGGVNTLLPQAFTLAGHSGNILRWEYKTPTSGWNNWNQAGQTFTGNCCFGTTSGTWKVRAIIGGSGCPEVPSSEGSVVVLPNPTANFNIGISGNVVTLTNTSSNGNTYAWTFGDNTTSGVFSPIKTYTANGTYSVKLRTTNSCGRFSEITKTVTVNCIPTATITGTQTINTGQSANLSVALTGSGPWSVIVNGIEYNNITTSPKIIAVSPSTTATYAISAVSNSCGFGTFGGSATVTVNQGYCPNQADLIVSDINITKYTPDRIYYNVIVKNIGTIGTSMGSFSFSSYGSTDAILNAEDEQKNVLFLGGGTLNRDQSITYSAWSSLDWRSNRHYLIVNADHYNLISECTETNNSKSLLAKKCSSSSFIAANGSMPSGLTASNQGMSFNPGTMFSNNSIFVAPSITGFPTITVNNQNVSFVIGTCLYTTTTSGATTNSNIEKPVFEFLESSSIASIKYSLSKPQTITISIWGNTEQAKLSDIESLQSKSAGEHTLNLNTSAWVSGQIYIIHFETPSGHFAKVVEW